MRVRISAAAASTSLRTPSVFLAARYVSMICREMLGCVFLAESGRFAIGVDGFGVLAGAAIQAGEFLQQGGARGAFAGRILRLIGLVDQASSKE